MPMSPRLLRPISTTHPEAQAWRNAVIANGGTVSGSTLNAVSRFCRSIDAAGIRDRFYRLNLFCGTGLNAALVPLYRGQSRTGSQFGNTTDTNNGPFVSGDFSESSGLKGDGTSKSLDTGLAQNTFSVANAHISASFTELEASGTRVPIAANGFTAPTFFTAQSDGTNFQGFALSLTPLTTAQATSASQLLLSRTSTTAAALYLDGTSVATSTATVTAGDSSATYRLFFRQDAVQAIGRTAIRLRLYTIGLGLSAAQASSLASAVSSLNTALGRA
jgi:hypothetical protein